MALAEAETTLPDPKMAQGGAFIDGAFVPVQDAKISVLDFGLTRSDCTYDVVGVWKGRFFRLDRHLDRFEASCERLRLALPLSREELEATLHRLVALTGLEDAYVSMTLTRGRPNPAAPRDPRQCVPNFYAYAIPYVWLANEAQQAKGLALKIARDVARISRRSVDQRTKNYHWLDLEMALLHALDDGADSVLLMDIDGNLTEGPGYNVFAYRDGVWSTPDTNVLEGITRGAVLDLLAEMNVGSSVRPMTEDDLFGAEEVIVTTTAGGVMPVTAVDGRPVGDGTPGPQAARLKALYWDKHTDPAWSVPVDRTA
ncbi:branched-chain amino acid transferase [Acuticoccus sediminis]|uniref:Probable branched-chain-amino-acid aminotransferase n=1 Tax=Acuticoccus sediminis TaxID=2184697 RepID=A0A8B2NSW4_9HYPH|nr:aminotransferase class IV [Acuticoccus sediminis]RAH99359.1 branched-chain amino acid transferase [Acuticoccus sediminis]